MALKVVRTQLIVLGVTLIACEIALQVLAPLTPLGALLGQRPAAPAISVPDDVLGARGNPLHRDHDARGYRNARVPVTADVVVLGDSQTYGTSVKRDDAWPAILQRRTGLTVYNMAFAGYGPGHSERQLPEALALKPLAVVVGFYFGNDFFDAFSLARRERTPPELVGLTQRAAALDAREPMEETANRFFLRGRTEQQPEQQASLRRWLGKHVMMYALAREVRNRMAGPPPLLSGNFQRAVAALTPTDREYVSVVDGPDWRTILTARYRHLVLDQRDPRVLLGFEVAVRSLQSMAARCRSVGVQFAVVLIPTKESVFWPRIVAPQAHAQLPELVIDEAAFRTRLADRLRRAGIDVLDVLPALRGSVAQPYLENADGHPSPAGHAVITERVAGWVMEHARPRSSHVSTRLNPDVRRAWQ